MLQTCGSIIPFTDVISQNNIPLFFAHFPHPNTIYKCGSEANQWTLILKGEQETYSSLLHSNSEIPQDRHCEGSIKSGKMLGQGQFCAIGRPLCSVDLRGPWFYLLRISPSLLYSLPTPEVAVLKYVVLGGRPSVCILVPQNPYRYVVCRHKLIRRK